MRERDDELAPELAALYAAERAVPLPDGAVARVLAGALTALAAPAIAAAAGAAAAGAGSGGAAAASAGAARAGAAAGAAGATAGAGAAAGAAGAAGGAAGAMAAGATVGVAGAVAPAGAAGSSVGAAIAIAVASAIAGGAAVVGYQRIATPTRMVPAPAVSPRNEPRVPERAVLPDAPPPPPPPDVARPPDAAPPAAGAAPAVPATPRARGAAAPEPGPAAALPPRATAAAPGDREALLVDRARAALRRGLVDEALVALMRHERLHPRGALAEERDVLVIEAYAARGDRALARKRIARYRGAHPQGFLRARVDAVEVGLEAAP